MIGEIVAASQPASGWLRVSTLTTYTSPLPPPHMGPGSVSQHSSHMDGQPASAHNSPVLYIYPPMTLINPVYSEPLSVTVPVVISTCTVLVGTVESVPVPPQHTFGFKMTVVRFLNYFSFFNERRRVVCWAIHEIRAIFCTSYKNDNEMIP